MCGYWTYIRINCNSTKNSKNISVAQRLNIQTTPKKYTANLQFHSIQLGDEMVENGEKNELQCNKSIEINIVKCISTSTALFFVIVIAISQRFNVYTI